MARTQKERREETVARLLEASIVTIAELGYARASAGVITKRAELSDGALFRHFATMGDFMAATAEEVLRRQIELFGKRVAKLPADEPMLEGVLTILGELTSNRTNAVLYELMIAARTDEGLRRTMQRVLEEYQVKIYEVAQSLPIAAQFPSELFPMLVMMLSNVFDGAAILRPVLRIPEIEAGRIPMLLALLEGVGKKRS